MKIKSMRCTICQSKNVFVGRSYWACRNCSETGRINYQVKRSKLLGINYSREFYLSPRSRPNPS